MVTFFSYMVTFLAIIFWMFRVAVVLLSTLNIEFIVEPINLGVEIAVLFITVVCLLFIARRKLIGAIVYFTSYMLYFGVDIYNKIFEYVNRTAGEVVTLNYIEIILSALGIILSLITLIDIGFNKEVRGTGTNKKTDWFYTNPEYQRKLDERTDKNEYKF